MLRITSAEWTPSLRASAQATSTAGSPSVTRLAQRLREDGLAVYGFGERRTPEAFRIACPHFICVKNFIEAAGPAPTTGDPKVSVSVAAERHRKKDPRARLSSAAAASASPRSA
jgi:hypothetical protein